MMLGNFIEGSMVFVGGGLERRRSLNMGLGFQHMHGKPSCYGYMYVCKRFEGGKDSHNDTCTCVASWFSIL